MISKYLNFFLSTCALIKHPRLTDALKRPQNAEFVILE